MTFGRDCLVVLIDGKPVFGTDATLPKNQLTSVILTIGKKVSV